MTRPDSPYFNGDAFDAALFQKDKDLILDFLEHQASLPVMAPVRDQFMRYVNHAHAIDKYRKSMEDRINRNNRSSGRRRRR